MLVAQSGTGSVFRALFLVLPARVTPLRPLPRCDCRLAILVRKPRSVGANTALRRSDVSKWPAPAPKLGAWWAVLMAARSLRPVQLRGAAGPRPS